MRGDRDGVRSSKRERASTSNFNSSSGNSAINRNEKSSTFTITTPQKPSTSSPFWSYVPSAIMFFLNLCLIVASIFALSNWTHMTWMLGSAGWSAILEAIALLLLLYMLLNGCCLLSFRSRLHAAFHHYDSSPQCARVLLFAMPFMCGAFFIVLTVLSLGKIKATYLYIAAHAEAVFNKANVANRIYINATSGANEGVYITLPDFTSYICSLDNFQQQCDPTSKGYADFTSYLSDIFDGMDSNLDRLVFKQEIYGGVISALEPYQQRFGWSVLAISLINALQFAYYYYMWHQHSKANNNNNNNVKNDKEKFMAP